MSKTIIIDNFSGESTPELIGTVNSGKIPLFSNGSGKLPFATQYLRKGLSFIESNYAITGDAITAPILHTIRAFVSNPVVCGVAMDGSVYNIGVSTVSTPTPDLDSATKYTGTVGATLNYGGGLYYDAGAQLLVVGHDSGVAVSSANPLANSASATFSQATGSWNLTNVPRPLCFFLGTLYVGDGQKLVSLNSSYAAIVSNSVLSPTLPTGYCIRNLQVSNDGRYMIITASLRTNTNDFNVSTGHQPQYQPLESVILYWNGTDATFSSMQFFKGLNIVSVISSATDTIMFGKDIRGTGIFDLSGNRLAGIDDITTSAGLPTGSWESYPPSLYSVDAMGKLFFFLIQIGENLFLYLFDMETRKLYPLYSDSLPTTGSVCGNCTIASIHANAVISNAWAEATRSKIYYTYKDIGGGTPVYRKFAVHLQYYAAQTVTGSYCTQIEEFARKIRPKKVRVYTLPTASGVSFSVRLLDSQFNIVSNNTYTFAAGTDSTKAQGAMTCVEFSVTCKGMGSLGVQIVPNASVGFYVEKIEIDYDEVGKPNPN